jgi:hypothetical protein
MMPGEEDRGNSKRQHSNAKKTPRDKSHLADALSSGIRRLGVLGRLGFGFWNFLPMSVCDLVAPVGVKD